MKRAILRRKRVKPDVLVNLTAVIVNCPAAEPIQVRQVMWDVLRSKQRTDNLLVLAIATLNDRVRLPGGRVIGRQEEGVSDGA